MCKTLERIDYRKEEIPFTQVANSVLSDPNLSAKAKGLYAYLYSKPDGWDFAVDRIALEMTDGRKGINSGLQELEKAGYLRRQKQADGRVEYSVLLNSLIPQKDNRVKKPDVPKGKVPKRQSAQKGMISNTDIQAIKSNSNTELAGSENPTPAGVERLENHSFKEKAKHNPLGAEIIKAFEEVDAKNKRYYNNTTQREACDFLVEEYGLETVLSVIKILPKTNGQPYIPVITTPVQLRDKWTPLKNALIKKKAEQATRSAGRTVII